MKLTIPLQEDQIKNLRAGDTVTLTGIVYTARDAAHKRLVEMIQRGEALPFDVKDAFIYYVGPSPTQPGHVIGSAGPTTSYRMDAYTPKLLDLGLKGMIGKGERNDQVIESMKKNHAVYFAAIGGAAALIAKSIKQVELVAFEDLGTEAIRKLYVEDLPVIVAVDSMGNDLYKQAVQQYQSE